MLFTTLATLLLSLPALAAPLSARQAPTPYAWTCEVVTHPTTGAYIDQGCGIALRDDSSPRLCVRTAYNTAGNAPVVATSNCFAGSPGGFGGRFDVKLGETRLRNMEAATADFCLAADANRTAAVMAPCESGQGGQVWVSSLSPNNPPNATAAEHKFTFALQTDGCAVESLCLTSPGQDGGQFMLKTCDGSTSQDFMAPGLQDAVSPSAA